MTDLNVFSVDLIMRFIINLVALIILLRLTYYRHSPNRDMLLGFGIFGQGVFLVTGLLHNIEMSMGFAFGLFAVFSMLRYRTESISIRDMTYLFAVIVISLMSAVGPVSALELIILNGLMCLLMALAETSLLAPKVSEKMIVYENIKNVHPSQYDKLIEDLETRTGLNIIEAKIGNIDYLRDVATIKITHKNVASTTATTKHNAVVTQGKTDAN